MQGNTTKYIIGIDIVGSKCAVIVSDKEFNIYLKVQLKPALPGDSIGDYAALAVYEN